MIEIQVYNFFYIRDIYVTINFSIPLTMHTFTLKSLCAVCVLNSKDSIPLNGIPQSIKEDLRNIITMCKLRKEESVIEEKLEDVNQRLSAAFFNARLYLNMYMDYVNEDEFRDYIYMRTMAYGKEMDECLSERGELELEEIIRDGVEAMVLTQLPKEEFPEIYSLLELLE